jgi:penicillin-binding protein 1A
MPNGSDKSILGGDDPGASRRAPLGTIVALRSLLRAIVSHTAAIVSAVRPTAVAVRRKYDNLSEAIVRALDGARQRIPRLAFATGRVRQRTSAESYAAIASNIVVLALCVLPIALLVWMFHDIHLPSPEAVITQRVIVLEAANGQSLFSKTAVRSAPVAAEGMPKNLLDAVISIEDRRFYQHGGIDLRSTLRAFIQNLKARHVVAGGSTITQQLVKTLFLGPERTYTRKIDEAAIAIWLELHLSKSQIMTSYLNNVYLGSGAIGFPAAARIYFGKDIADLTLPEAAMLAGMIKAPNQYDPLRNLDAARVRAAIVLDAMVENGKLTREAALDAKAHPATPKPAGAPPSGWFADWVYGQAADLARPFDGPVRVRTTLDPRLQALAQNVIASALDTTGRQRGVTQAALVALRPDGAVVAMIGGRSYAESQFNRAVQAKRQPGSAFKLFDYYAALRNGYSLDDEILDEPVDVDGWEPDNFGLNFHGEVTLADAFAHSLNAATVRLTQEIGIDQVIAAARDLGLRSPLGNNPSLALGTSEVTLLDLTSAFAAVRAGVAPIEPWGISALSAGDRKEYQPVARAHPPQHSIGRYQRQLIDLLRGVVERGTGRAAAMPGLVAAKTGTSQDFRDAWFIGFNEALIVGVWVGNDDHSPMKSVTGGSIPASIWKRFMEGVGPIATTTSEQPQANATFNTAEASGTPANTAIVDSAQCNIPVCERYYRSFRAADCTYQPFWGGERRYCER